MKLELAPMPQLLRRRLSVLALAAALTASLHAGDSQWTIPDTLKEWKDDSYKVRWFLEADAPGEAGHAGLYGDPQFATITLPLKTVADAAGTPHAEPFLLMGEDGSVHAATSRIVGSDVEIYFRSQPGLRRFCLYAGFEKTDKRSAPQRVSPRANEMPRERLKMRARSANPGFAYSPETPLTLDRFQKLEASGEKPLAVAQEPIAYNIDQPHVPVPYYDVSVNIFGNIRKVDNPKNYVCFYDGAFRAPVDGTYAFSLDTLGVAHLLVNGKAVISVDAPDAARAPFKLQGTVDLPKGVHRVQVYYAEANNPMGPSNLEQQKFGLRLHWKPPFAKDFICMPPQAFVRAMPAEVERYETAKDYAEPFIHIEKMAHVRVGSHLGPRYETEKVLLVARAVGTPPDATLLVTAQGASASSGGATGMVATWVPAGSVVQIGISGSQTVRSIQIPLTEGGLSTGVMNLEGEMSLKSVPEFLYPNETGHLHLEAMLGPLPIIIYKERLESKLIPPPARPMGQYRLHWSLNDGQSAVNEQEADVTPVDGPRFKSRVSYSFGEMEKLAASGQACLKLDLSVGGVEAEHQRVRVLHSTAQWPGSVIAGPGRLYYTPRTPPEGQVFTLEEQHNAPGPNASPDKASANVLSMQDLERVMILVPEENEAEYRRYAPLKNVLSRVELGKSALFLGDPLIEGIQPKPNGGELFGLGKQIATALPEFTWAGVNVAGPHRHLPVFRVISALESYLATQPNRRVPGLVIVSLGGGDVARQTPLHGFERGIDTLIDRLRVAGARRVVFVGVLPEPFREDHARIYQERLADVLRRHHTDGVDVFGTWTRETDWMRRFSLDGSTQGETLYGSTLNKAALEELAKMTKDRL